MTKDNDKFWLEELPGREIRTDERILQTPLLNRGADSLRLRIQITSSLQKDVANVIINKKEPILLSCPSPFVNKFTAKSIIK